MKRKTHILLLVPFLLVMLLLLVSVWNVLTQSMGIIPAFGLTEPTFDYYSRVLGDGDFLASLRVSLSISLWSAIFACIFGVLLSMALIKLNKTREAFCMPFACPYSFPMRWRRCLPFSCWGRQALGQGCAMPWE